MDMPVDLVVGSLNGRALYAVTISTAGARRARELAAAGAVPDWIEQDVAANGVRIMTPEPRWFTDLDRDVAAAARAR